MYARAFFMIMYLPSGTRIDTHNAVSRRVGTCCPRVFRLPLRIERVGNECPPYLLSKSVNAHCHLLRDYS